VTSVAGPQTPRLEVLGATVVFGERVAIDAVDLAVDPGEVVAVLGASGSGKSTLLRAVAGLQVLDAGAVRLDGSDVTGMPPHRRGVGLMFQDHALFPHRDVAANIAFGLRMQGRARADVSRRVEELLQLVGLGGMGARAVQTLSGGEQQRVALARALAPEPRLLLLDEPLGSLDRSLRERLVAELQRLFRELALTVVAVTHDQVEAFTIADRIVVLHDGALVRSGTPAEVWGSPERVAVAELLGFANLAPATIHGATAHTPWGELPVRGGAARAATVLVRPSGVRIDPDGPLRATVAARGFAGERSTLTLDVDGAPPLEADVPTSAAPGLGTTVRVRLDPEHIQLLDR
jgi:thiamine transport system ATP-binding protein